MVANFLKFLEYEKRYSAHTIIAYEKDLQQLFGFLRTTFEITDYKDILHPHLRSWIVQLMENGIGPKSINRKIATLKSYFKFLQGREFISKNPATRLKPLKTGRQLPAFVRENDINQLLDHLSEISVAVYRDNIHIRRFNHCG